MFFLDFYKQLNWVDIFVIILLIRIFYVALKNGFSTEIFKLLGTICAIYLACHYYIRAGSFLSNFTPLKEEVWLDFLKFVSFFILAFFGYFLFVIIRTTFTFLIRMEAISLLNRWGAFILGIARCALFTSLLFFTINLSNISYLKNSLSDSLSGPVLVKLSPKVYTSLWKNLMFRFTGKGALNVEVSQFRSKPAK